MSNKNYGNYNSEDYNEKLSELKKQKRLEDLKERRKHRNAIMLWAITMTAVVLLVIAIISRL